MKAGGFTPLEKTAVFKRRISPFKIENGLLPSSVQPKKRFLTGFTLIECVVAVVILSLLASLATTAYVLQKRRSEYNGMRATMQALAAAVKNRFYTIRNIQATASTAATNTNYGLQIREDTFYRYRVETVVFPFRMRVSYRRGVGAAQTALYTFNSNATQVSCAGADCMLP